MKISEDFFESLFRSHVDRAVIDQEGHVTVKRKKKWESLGINLEMKTALQGQIKKELKIFKTHSGVFLGYPSLAQNGSVLFLKAMTEAHGLKAWGLPQLYMKSFLSKRGLSVISGPKESGRSTILHLLMQEVLKTNAFVTFVSEDWPLFKSDSRYLKTFSKISDLDEGTLKFSDHVFIDSTEASSLETAVNLCKQGVPVCLVSSQNDFCGFDQILRRRADYAEVIRNLSTFLSPRVVEGVDQSMLGLFELVMMTPELKSELTAYQGHQPFPLQSYVRENSGSRTLNQTLFQNLVQRKIDLKTGYELSEYPDELDQMMKKVGL